MREVVAVGHREKEGTFWSGSGLASEGADGGRGEEEIEFSTRIVT